MRSKFLAIVTVVLVAVLLAIPMYNASASSKISPSGVRQQDSVTCKDKDFLTNVGKDFTDLSGQLGQLKQEPADQVKAVLLLASLRQKYEDLTTTTDCFPTQVSLVVLLSNLSDVYALALGKAADSANAADYDKAITNQTTRNKKLLNNFLVSIGAATPEAVATQAQ